MHLHQVGHIYALWGPLSSKQVFEEISNAMEECDDATERAGMRLTAEGAFISFIVATVVRFYEHCSATEITFTIAVGIHMIHRRGRVLCITVMAAGQV